MKQYRPPSSPVPAGIVAISLLLSACGGGGGDAGGAAPAAPQATPPAATQTSGDPLPADDTTTPSTTQSSSSPTTSLSNALANGAQVAQDNTPEHSKATASPVAQELVRYSASYSGVAYHVSSVNGNDDNSGSAEAPWRTLARASQAKLNAGDALLLRCDGTWAETPVFGASFAPKGQVVIGAYGSCASGRKPEIRGSIAIPAANWQLVSSTGNGSVFSTRINGPIAGIFHNAKPMVKARHPNLVSATNNFASARVGTAGSKVVVSATDMAVFAGRDLNGAAVGLRSAAYMIEQAELATYDSGSGALTLAAAPKAELHTGIGYFLEGKRWMLDSPNEWLYEADTQTLLVFVAAGDSVSNVFEFTSPRPTLTVKGIPGVVLENLSITNAGAEGIYVVDSGSAKLAAVDVTYARTTGISIGAPSWVVPGQGVTIERSTVNQSGITGIASSVSNTNVIGNTVADTGTTILGALRPTAAIRIDQVKNVVVGSNNLRRSGYSSILFANGENVAIRDNYIEDSCIVLSDCGAIYSWGANESGTRATIANNHIVRTSTPNLNGTGTNPSSGAPALLAGIYLDEGSSNIDVVNNHITDAYVGINLHKAKNNNILRNSIYGVREAGLRFHSSGADTRSVVGNRVEDNSIFSPVFFVKGADGNPISVGGTAQIWIHQNDASSMLSGTGNNTSARNVVVHMGEEGGLRWILRSAGTDNVLNSKTWVTRAPSDTVRTPYKASIASVQGTQLVGNSRMTGGALPWTTYSYAAGATIATFGNQSACEASCATFTSKTTNDVLQQIGIKTDVAGPDLMFIRYRVHAGSKATSSKFEVRNNTSPFASAGYMEPGTSLAANSRLSHEAFFVRNSKNDLRVSVKSTVDAPLHIDNVEIFQVTGYQLNSPLWYGKLIANRSNQATGVSCEEASLTNCNIVDESGAPLSWPVAVPAQGSRMVFIKDSSWVLN